MKVTRSGYYAWRRREPSQRQKENERLLSRIHAFFEASKGTYGSLRIVRDLREEGFYCGKHRVARLMRQAGLRGRGRAAFPSDDKLQARISTEF